MAKNIRTITDENGKTYTVRTVYRVKASVKQALITMGAVAVLTIGVGATLLAGVSEDDIRYEKVFIGAGETAHTAINQLNGKDADKHELVPFFTEKNNLDSAGKINVGYYYVPVLKENN